MKMQCKVCKTKFDTKNWARDSVKKGFCPDCGAKAQRYFSKDESLPVQYKSGRSKLFKS